MPRGDLTTIIMDLATEHYKLRTGTADSLTICMDMLGIDKYVTDTPTLHGLATLSR